MGSTEVQQLVCQEGVQGWKFPFQGSPGQPREIWMIGSWQHLCLQKATRVLGGRAASLGCCPLTSALACDQPFCGTNGRVALLPSGIPIRQIQSPAVSKEGNFLQHLQQPEPTSSPQQQEKKPLI